MTGSNGFGTRGWSAIAALAMVISLAACGGSSSPKAAPPKPKPRPKVSAAKVVLDSVRTTTAAKSARIAMTISTAGQTSFSSTLSGVTDFATGDSQLTMQVPAGLGSAGSGSDSGGLMVERTVNHVTYVQLPAGLGSGLGIPKGARWISIPLPVGSSMPTSLLPGGAETDPTQMLAYLEAVSSDVKTVGPQTVRGVATTHYHALLDLGKAIDQTKVPPALRESLKQILSVFAGHLSAIPVDVWVDSDGRVRRVTEQIDLGSLGAALRDPSSGATGPTGSDSSFTITTSMDVYDFGVPVHVQAPPADQVVQLPGLGDLGLNGGGSFGATGSSGASGSAS